MNKKENIMISSLRILSDKGMEKTKLDDIARDAGVGKGTIYLYFKNKNDLYISSITYLMNRWIDEAGKIVNMDTDARNKLSVYIDRTLTEVNKNKSFARILMRELPNYIIKAKKEKMKKPLKMYSMRSSHLASIIRQGISEGVFKDNDTDVLANIIIGSLNSFIMTYIIESANMDKKKLGTYKKLILDMLKKEDQ